jgi:hypothetical protein
MTFSQASPILMAAVMTWLAVLPASAVGQSAPTLFFFKSYMGRCLDFGPPPLVVGAPVFISIATRRLRSKWASRNSGRSGAFPRRALLRAP